MAEQTMQKANMAMKRRTVVLRRNGADMLNGMKRQSIGLHSPSRSTHTTDWNQRIRGISIRHEAAEEKGYWFHQRWTEVPASQSKIMEYSAIQPSEQVWALRKWPDPGMWERCGRDSALSKTLHVPCSASLHIT
jgi:hypothetical protein